MSDKPYLPGGPTAHVDTFARDNLPPRGMWADIDYSSLPELRAYPDRLNAAEALLDMRVAAGDGARPVIHFGDTTWSYAELADKAARIARVLVDDYGIEPGNRVLLRGPNNPMMAATWLAVVKAGGVCVATMPLLRARELAYIIEKAQVRHALCDIDLAGELEAARKSTPLLEIVGLFTARGDGANSDADLDRRMARAEARFATIDTAADDAALIAFTSGTTGPPKGAVHFHRDILAMCDTFAKYVFDASPDDVYTGSPPLAFTFGLGALLCFPMRFGSSVALVDKPSPDALIESITRHKVTALYTAPVMFRALTDMVAAHDLSSLVKCVSAGENLPLPTYQGWHEATGIRIMDGLGSTEMIHIFVSAAGDKIRPGATGKAIPGYQACVVDDEGAALPPGEIGNLAVRGPTACRYLDDIERQAAYVKKGWNLPGDIYRADADGYFWYQARADDMIISAGYNISGPEVESVLLEHPKVEECAVVGAPDQERGRIVKAFVVLRASDDAGAEMAKELQDFVKAEIAPYKYPREVEFIDALPRTETGKVQRFKLREEAEKKVKPGD